MKSIPDKLLAEPGRAHGEATGEPTDVVRRSLLQWFRGLSPLFAGLVIVPTLLATLYFGFLASEAYVSESRFIVRSPSKPNLSPLGMVLSGGNIVGASEESEAVTKFLGSRQALETINQDGYVTRAWGNGSIFWFDRFGFLGKDTGEDLFEYFLGKVTANDSSSTMVTVLTVKSFDPQSAQQSIGACSNNPKCSSTNFPIGRGATRSPLRRPSWPVRGRMRKMRRWHWLPSGTARA